MVFTKTFGFKQPVSTFLPRIKGVYILSDEGQIPQLRPIFLDIYWCWHTLQNTLSKLISLKLGYGIIHQLKTFIFELHVSLSYILLSYSCLWPVSRTATWIHNSRQFYLHKTTWQPIISCCQRHVRHRILGRNWDRRKPSFCVIVDGKFSWTKYA